MSVTRRTFATLIAGLAVTPLTTNRLIAAPADQPQGLMDLAYADASPRNRLDVSLPSGTGPFPWVLDLHGGGFLTGDKRSLPVPQTVLDHGVAVVRANYRLSNQALWPAQQADVLAAIDYLNKHASTLRLIPGRFALGGRSAGAFLAVSAALELVRQGRAPNAVVDFYGPMDFGSMDKDMAGMKTSRPPADSAQSVESLLVGYPVGQRRAEASAMSPVGQLGAMTPGTALPPLMIRHGAQDRIVSVGQAERLRRAWTALDPRAPLDFQILPHDGHGSAGFGSGPVLNDLANFLARNLGVVRS